MLKITGASDDLIEIDGDIVEELTCYMRESEEKIIAVSDGTLLKVNYSDAIWRFLPLIEGSLFEGIKCGNIEQDTFDEAFFGDGVKWVILGDQKAIKKNNE